MKYLLLLLAMLTGAPQLDMDGVTNPTPCYWNQQCHQAPTDKPSDVSMNSPDYILRKSSPIL